jgi:hypothetical protein
MAILYSIVYLLASVLGVVAVAIAAAFDYFAWGFVGPLAIMTAVVVLFGLSGLFGSEVEYKGGFVPGGAWATASVGASVVGASVGASAGASGASSSGSSICGADSGGGCVGGSCC